MLYKYRTILYYIQFFDPKFHWYRKNGGSENIIFYIIRKAERRLPQHGCFSEYLVDKINKLVARHMFVVYAYRTQFQ